MIGYAPNDYPFPRHTTCGTFQVAAQPYPTTQQGTRFISIKITTKMIKRNTNMIPYFL